LPDAIWEFNILSPLWVHCMINRVLSSFFEKYAIFSQTNPSFVFAGNYLGI
jgi:hypothetical protein